jgi:hypothetical protein
MITIGWDAFTDATATSFNVYRSLPGITIAFPNTLTIGDVFTFSATSVDIQNITFTAVDIDSVVSQFNANALGAYAVKDAGGTNILIRTTATTKAKLKLYACTFLTHIGQAPRTVVPALEWALIGSVAFLTNTYSYTFTDSDGIELDSYKITSVVSSIESLPSLIQRPQVGAGLLCAIEGRVCDSQNRAVVGLVIRAEPRIPETSSDGHGIDYHRSQVCTDGFGRFSLYLPRNETYLLQIPDIGYNETICVPDLPSAGFLDVIPTLAGRFSPFGDPQ